ncbi:hypothetical protein [Kitasatospora sp. GP30]|uniref:hypothetical protein n=1 Tax=Kitasatospora sp. GP30 TaxID=3035084 RepID=UPI000C712414|nr:hypothetical protein [Kitasatospora sp. GP30]
MLLRSGTDGDAPAAAEVLAGAATEAGAAALPEEPREPPQAVAPAARTAQSTAEERVSRLEYMAIL